MSVECEDENKWMHLLHGLTGGTVDVPETGKYEENKLF